MVNPISAEARLWEVISTPISDYFSAWQAAQSSVINACCKEIFTTDRVVLSWPQRPHPPGALLSHSQQYTFVRYGGGEHYARFSLSTAPASSDTLLFDFKDLPDRHTNQPHPLPLAQHPDWLYIFPGLLKGLWDGLQKHPLPAGQWVIEQVVIHPIDSKPLSFYLCGLQAIKELKEKSSTQKSL